MKKEWKWIVKELEETRDRVHDLRERGRVLPNRPAHYDESTGQALSSIRRAIKVIKTQEELKS